MSQGEPQQVFGEIPKDDKVLVTIEVETDLYFNMMEVCLRERWTIDEFVERALRNLIETHEKSAKKKKK